MELPNDVAGLRLPSRAEGFGHVERLCADFEAGSNRFDRLGEALFTARDAGRLIGIAGLNRDPFEKARVGRVRRMYVLPESRREGVGRALLVAIEDHARCEFEKLTLFTGTDRGAQFYEGLGYEPVAGVERVSHCKRLF